jgi:hypothetical protein
MQETRRTADDLIDDLVFALTIECSDAVAYRMRVLDFMQYLLEFEWVTRISCIQELYGVYL